MYHWSRFTGWVCYAEKAHSGTASVPTTAIGEAFSIVPFLSQVRSPQQIIGRLVKSDNPEAIFHVTIMPCFDKKLEATRLEFSTESKNGDRTSDVDLVLATNELVQMISTCDVGHNWAACSPTLSSSLQSQLLNLQQRFQNLLPATDAAPAANLGPPVLYRHLGSGSGGYAASVFVHAAAELFSVVIADPFEDPRVIVRQLHNRDFQEMLLFATTADCDAVKQGLDQLPNKRIPFRHSKLPQTALLAFAVANGFRNIQNVVQRLKTACLSQTGSYSTSSSSTYRPSTFPFDYVEIMACPGGCLNGGGQITGSLTETKAFYEELVPVPPFSTPGTRNLYDYLTRSDPEHGNLRTTYRQVPKIEVINSAALRW
ncbi:Cytosolic Fe-S cluster assembly factor NARFL [Fasciola hepatica]|uniref:Cytosolic Fe-S cluster assembly factor NARFL n=1 Tax=Fasciola hepatica TaxID=6192 RepID=A0A4E0RQC2_FASHE|nr:Cytosolic Fe-S cluster assembly factor NARFL [Fasciola hepatica]